MGFLMGGSNSAQAQKLSAIQIQTMGYGAPIQLCYGSNRVSPTLGYSTDFTATYKESGKGGGSGSYTYTATIMLFMGEGTLGGYGKVWKDKDIYDTTTLAGFSHSTTGTASQALWGDLLPAHQDQALTYAGTAYLSAKDYDLGQGASLGNHSVEVRGHALSSTATDVNYTDAYIRDIISDFLTNPHYGAISASTATLPLALSRLHTYTQAAGLLISPLISSQKPAHEYLSEWATVANCGIVWSEGTLKFIPYDDENLSGNGVSYQADTVIRYHFDDDNLSTPLKPTRKKHIDCYNKLSIECLNRANAYNKHTVEAKDQAEIEQYGLRQAQTLSLESVCLPDVAQKIAYNLLSRGLYIRNEYQLHTCCDADFLEPLDFVTVTDANLGLHATRCRIIALEDEQDGNLIITVEEAPEGVYHG